MMADCELENACMIDKVNKYAADKSTPLYNVWLGKKMEVEKVKDGLLNADKVCGSKPAIEVKKIIAKCIKRTTPYIDSSFQQGLKLLNTCIINDLKPLAESGNVFALISLVDRDKANSRSWQRKFDTQKGSEFYENAMLCSSEAFKF